MSTRKSCKNDSDPAADEISGHPDDRPYPLAEAVRRFLGPPWTANSLRTEIRKGRLVAERIAGKLAVTEAAIREMRVLCRRKPKGQDSTSVSTSTGMARDGSSGTVDTTQAQDALRATFQALSKPSQTTSGQNTQRRKPAGS
jgi:hypothetical protein